MDAKEVIARRIALEPKTGDLVNLGIGLPTMVASYLPREVQVLFQAENGLIGMQPLQDPGLADEYLADPGGSFVSAIPGACSFDSCMSFGLIRGGHLDITVLGGLEVDEQGLLANWMVPGKMVPGMGGAMDLVTGARRVIVAMQHTVKGKPKILKSCTLPLTSIRPVSIVVTELAVLETTERGLLLKEVAPGVTPQYVIAATEARLIVPADVPTMRLAQ
ncbi:MAG TPA: 3-oxoacid CoA-transferase subunit B [Casimicrobiaceae bacterium]|nr:3-oxoacid CoA-transferase subunit B [Casimicrobiaceae bacterium]